MEESNSHSVAIRTAHINDIAFIRELAAESSRTTIPATRDIDSTEVRLQAQQALANLESVMAMPQGIIILIAEQRTTEGHPNPLGYIILDFTSIEPSTGERQCFIHDLAVVPAAWGRRVGHLLVEKAEQLAAERGLKYLVGMVSANNRRALLPAQRDLGFEIERFQIVKRLHFGE